MNIQDLKVGDLLAKRNNTGFLPTKIQFFMKLWAKIRYKTSLPEYYSHMMIVTDKGKLAEAVARGFIQRDFTELNNTIVFRAVDPVTEEEAARITKEAQEMANKNIEYEILNFFWWMPYIVSNGKIDWSPKGSKAEKRLFCFEAACMLFEAGRPGTFEKPDKVTTVDMQMDKRFKLYELE